MSIGSILFVLALSANTAFADFPRLSRAIAQNGFMPHGMTLRGRRLVFAQGVYLLAGLAGGLLILFGGVTDRLIPLYAVGAFLAFTLSQAGMVMHWKRMGGSGAGRSMLINGLGAVATSITVIVVLVAKFTEGAWITVLLIPGMMLTMRGIKRHYDRVEEETRCDAPLDVEDLTPPLVVIPIERWSVIAQKAVRFAWKLSPEIKLLHVDCGDDADEMRNRWRDQVDKPAREAGLPVPEFVTLQSPFRFVIGPILDYVLALERANPHRQIAVIIPELVESRWYYNLLHNNRSTALKALLLFKGDHRVVVINIPWYLNG